MSLQIKSTKARYQHGQEPLKSLTDLLVVLRAKTPKICVPQNKKPLDSIEENQRVIFFLATSTEVVPVSPATQALSITSADKPIV